MCYMFLPGDMDLLQKIENMNSCIISLILRAFKPHVTATTKSLIKDLEGYIKTVMHHFFFFFRKLRVFSGLVNINH